MTPHAPRIHSDSDAPIGRGKDGRSSQLGSFEPPQARIDVALHAMGGCPHSSTGVKEVTCGDAGTDG